MITTGQFYNIEVFQGDHFSVDIQVQDDDEIPINLSGYVISGAIKNKYCTSAISTFFGISKIQPYDSGLFTITLDNAQIGSLPVSTLVYSISGIIQSTGQYFLGGKLIVYPAVI